MSDVKKSSRDAVERLAKARGWTFEYAQQIIEDYLKAEPASEHTLYESSRDPQRRLSLDFSYIAAGQAYYSALGYKETQVSWVIGEEAYTATLPENVNRYETIGGYLVGSAEQSFIQLLLEGVNPGKAQATSPCFRDEDHDAIHSPYFLKLELFDNVLPATEKNVLQMAEQAKFFFEKYLPVKIVQEGELSWDIQAAHSDLELGSYGIRSLEDHRWIYGTGVALPRLQQAVESL